MPLFCFFIFHLHVCWGALASPPQWKEWTEASQKRFQEPLAVPSIIQHIYFEKTGDTFYLQLSPRPRLTAQSCASCPLAIKRTEKTQVALLKPKSDKPVSQIGPEQNLALPGLEHLKVSVQDPRDGRLRLFLHDLSQKDLSEKRKRFFFPYPDQGVRQARFNWLKKARPVVIGRSDGSQKQMQVLAELTLVGQDTKDPQVLSVYDYAIEREQFLQSPQLMLIYRDLSNGKTTYGAGRFVDLSLGRPLKEFKDGDKVKIDFNFSYNPPCATSTGFHCPLPQDLINQEMEFGEEYRLAKSKIPH